MYPGIISNKILEGLSKFAVALSLVTLTVVAIDKMAAMMMGGGGLPGGFHKDVLEANPSDNLGKKNLAEECKNRAKGSLKQKNYPEAIALYNKAAEVMSGQDDVYVAVCYANMSMCKNNMGKTEEAAADADKAIALDPTYVKAYYRAGTAYHKLKRWEEAKAALLKGIEMKPDDKEMVALMDKVQAAIVRGEPAAASSKAVPKPSKQPTTMAAKSTPSAAKKAPAATTKAASVIEDEGGEEFRGYKKTSDGRTTTFFNNELDDQTKALIGDITPQAISPAAAAPAANADPTKGSAWNSAGTFESKNMTGWAKTRITELLKEGNAPADGCTITIKSVALEGDAEIVSARGKRKAIYDFIATLDWQMTFGIANSVNGTIKIVDIEADEGDYEVVEVTMSSTPSKEGQELVKKYCRSSSTGLQKHAFAAFDKFRAEMKSK